MTSTDSPGAAAGFTRGDVGSIEEVLSLYRGITSDGVPWGVASLQEFPSFERRFPLLSLPGELPDLKSATVAHIRQMLKDAVAGWDELETALAGGSPVSVVLSADDLTAIDIVQNSLDAIGEDDNAKSTVRQLADYLKENNAANLKTPVLVIFLVYILSKYGAYPVTHHLTDAQDSALSNEFAMVAIIVSVIALLRGKI